MLNTKQRQQARQTIEKYHQQKLVELQAVVFEKFKQLHQGKINAFELDHIIHIYHRQSQELYEFINIYYTHNKELPILLDLIKQEQKGEWKWEPKTKQENN